MSALVSRPITGAILLVAWMSVAGCNSLTSILGSSATHDLSLICTSPTSVSPSAVGAVRADKALPGPLCFRLEQQGINSIESLIFWSAQKGEPLWAISFAPTPVAPKDLGEIVYGELPHVPDEPQLRLAERFPRVKQWFPTEAPCYGFPSEYAEGKTREIAPGERFFIQVVYQYDIPVAACGGRKVFGFEVKQDGSIQALADCANVQLPPAVQDLAIKMAQPEFIEWRNSSP